jgi:hypothetical protein
MESTFDGISREFSAMATNLYHRYHPACATSKDVEQSLIWINASIICFMAIEIQTLRARNKE